jgi:YegS/Rv2252/BmrU family lipid kinase
VRRVAICSNPRAGRDARLLDAALEVFDQHGIRYERLSPANVEDQRQAIQSLVNHVDAVVVAGGDGTINAALPAVVEAALPMGVLPTGTANDFARTLGIPTDLTEAARAILQGHTRALDLGEVNGRLFCNVAHIGFGVHAQRRALNKRHKKLWGGLSYAMSLWSARRLLRPFTAELSVDGVSERVRTIHLGIGNGRYYGGGVPVQADAAIDDGLLDAYSVPPQGVLGLLHAISDLRRGGLPGSPVWRAKGHRISVHTRRPRRIMADGEVVGHTPAEFRVVPQILPVIVPAREHEQRPAGLCSSTESKDSRK